MCGLNGLIGGFIVRGFVVIGLELGEEGLGFRSAGEKENVSVSFLVQREKGGRGV